MGYKVLADFIEKGHKDTLYREGEEYPKKGFKADPDRVAYLQTKKSKYKIAFLGDEVKADTLPADEKADTN